MKIFEVNYVPEWARAAGRENGSSVRVIEYDDEATQATLIDGDEIVVEASSITIVFSYPLSREVEFTFENNRPYTRKDFWRVVYEGYKRIYREEDDAEGSTDNLPGMLNRGFSEGPYGIWGHHIDDLYLEGVKEISPNKFELCMGS